jgi:hypothetical protein
MSNFASTLVPSSGTGPGLTGLGGNRGKYIYELHLIFIANNFLIYGMPVVTEGIQNEKIHFSCFFFFLRNFTLLPLNAFSASKLAKMSEMS